MVELTEDDDVYWSATQPTVAPTSEILDLIAEAARTSPHAARAYELMRSERPSAIPSLAARQALVQGRMAL